MRIVKYFSLLLLFVFFAASCNENLQDEPQLKTGSDDFLSSKNSIRSIEDAAKIAQEAIGTFIDKNNSRSSNITFDSKNPSIVSKSHSRSGNDTIMYVFNFDDNQGYAVVAANKNYEGGLVAITEAGHYNVNGDNEVPGIDDYMARATTYLEGLTPNIPRDTIEDYDNELIGCKIVTDTTYFAELKPNKKLAWGQEIPEGRYCPNGVAGCANTAIAMLLSYIQIPINSLPLTFDNQTDTLKINWTELRNHKRSYRYEEENLLDEDGCNENTHETLAKLTRQLGTLAGSSYDFNFRNLGPATGTPVSGILNVLSKLNMEYNYYIISTDDLTNELLKGKRAIAIGTASAPEEYLNASHAWIIDGLYAIDYNRKEYIQYPGKPWEMTYDFGETHIRYYHINWGWCGMSNGYFNMGVYDATAVQRPDDYNAPKRDFTFKNVYFIPTWRKKNISIVEPLN